MILRFVQKKIIYGKFTKKNNIFKNIQCADYITKK